MTELENAGQFCCPMVLDRMRQRSAEDPKIHYASRYHSLLIKSDTQTDIERLAGVGSKDKYVGKELIYQLQFDLVTIVVARSASVFDTSDPKRKLPGGGLKLFRTRIETDSGDHIDRCGFSRTGSGGAPGDLFWGTGCRPAVITNGIFINQGGRLGIYLTPRAPDLEIDLGFWCVEERRLTGHRHYNM